MQLSEHSETNKLKSVCIDKLKSSLYRFSLLLCNHSLSKFWTRNRPGDKMRDRYNLNLLPGMSEDGMEYG